VVTVSQIARAKLMKTNVFKHSIVIGGRRTSRNVAVAGGAAFAG